MERKGRKEVRERERGREESGGGGGEVIKDVGSISLYSHHTNEGYRKRRKLKRVAGCIL